MTLRLGQLRVVGLGLMVGAILHSVAAAQVTPPPVRSDSARQDSIRARALQDSIARAKIVADSIARAKVVADSIDKADTLRTPIPGFPSPPMFDGDYLWQGDDILASGAVSLTELVSRVPGAVGFRSGFVTSPSAPAYAGCFRCVRYFLDGIEIAAPDVRSGGILDNAEIPLWQLQEVRIVRGANELRVYLRTWGVERTIPMTRIDILTGADEVSQFGGFLGKRTKSGGVFQFGAQQFGTNSRTNSGAGNRSSISVRVGIVKPLWGVDAYAIRTSRSRDPQESVGGLASLPEFKGSRTDAYVRATWGRPLNGSWLQFVAATMNVKERTPGTGPAAPAEGEPPADSSRTEAQYLFAGGTRLGGISLSGTARFRALDGLHTNELAATAAASLAGINVAAYLRSDTRDSLVAAELSVQANPLPLISLSGSVGQTSPMGSSTRPAAFFANADLGVRVLRATLHGGVLLRDSMQLAAPIVFDASLASRAETGAFGIYARLNGPVWRDIHADITTIHWDADGWYRPGQLTRASIYLDSWWPRKFPNRTFHIYAGLAYETRADTRFPSSANVVVAPGHTSISSLVEIRILSAVLTWQNRNIRGLEMSEVPGLRLPRRLSIYGVRWVLWN